MIPRARTEDGFGLVELLISMVMLNVGILAVVAGFNSGVIALRNAGEVSTASVLADKQMELYRALKYTAIALDQTELAAANADAIYQCDDANKIDPAGACGGANQAPAMSPPVSCVPLTPQCDPVQEVTGPDSRPYRVDTYVVSQTPPTGRALKLVTVVVRKADGSKVLTRLSSTFDQSSGS